MQEEPRALYVHCGNHSLNLAVQETCSSISTIRDCFSRTHKCSTFIRDSRQRSNMMKEKRISLEEEEHASPGLSSNVKLRSLCPTRFTVRHKAITALLDNYEPVLLTLEELSKSANDAGSVADGHLKDLRKGAFYLTLLICDEIVGLTDRLSVILQNPNTCISVSGSLEAVKLVLTQK